MSQNLHRRHLTESQRALAAVRVATLGVGRPTENASIEAIIPMAQDEAADLLHVGRASVQRARVVIDRAVPELLAAVDAGRIAVSQAAALATTNSPRIV